MRMIVQQGIAVHHAGLLPILKETIEILYANGLIKIMLATTSFAIGNFDKKVLICRLGLCCFLKLKSTMRSERR